MNKLKHTNKRVVVMVDNEIKNWHTFTDGTKIRLERGWENFNNRETKPTNAIVISAEDIPQGSEILIHHNSLHDVNKINDYKPLSESDHDIQYYSVPENECFVWIDANGNPRPLKGFALALRVFEPYNGVLDGIEPKLITNVLYITTGELSGNVCHVLTASDYEIIYQGKNGREARVIRLRHFEDDYNDREEVVAVSHSLTEKVKSGGLLIGLTPTTAKSIKESIYAD